MSEERANADSLDFVVECGPQHGATNQCRWQRRWRNWSQYTEFCVLRDGHDGPHETMKGETFDALNNALCANKEAANMDNEITQERPPEHGGATGSALLNAFEDAREAMTTAHQIMDGAYDTSDIHQCLDDLYECETHLRSPNATAPPPCPFRVTGKQLLEHAELMRHQATEGIGWGHRHEPLIVEALGEILTRLKQNDKHDGRSSHTVNALVGGIRQPEQKGKTWYCKTGQQTATSSSRKKTG